MALKKYRFFAGACGPTMLYSNIIRAGDERTATIIYLKEMGKDATEENIADELHNIREIIPKVNPDHLLDFLEKEIKVGDDVMFIKNKSGSAPKLCPGKVAKVTGKRIVVEDTTGDSSRIMLPEDESECLPRVIVMSPRPERPADGMIDASGYPVLDDDPIAYMKIPPYSNSVEFEMGRIEAIKGNKVLVNGTRKTVDRIVVLNW